MSDQPIKILFEQRHVDALKFDFLTEHFNSRVMSPEVLRAHMGRLEIKIRAGGIGDSPLRNPQIYKFMRALAQRWTPGQVAFFVNGDSAFGVVYALAQMSHAVVVERDVMNDFFVVCDRKEIDAFIETTAIELGQIAHRAQIDEMSFAEQSVLFYGHIFSAFVPRKFPTQTDDHE